MSQARTLTSQEVHTMVRNCTPLPRPHELGCHPKKRQHPAVGCCLAGVLAGSGGREHQLLDTFLLIPKARTADQRSKAQSSQERTPPGLWERRLPSQRMCRRSGRTWTRRKRAPWMTGSPSSRSATTSWGLCTVPRTWSDDVRHEDRPCCWSGKAGKRAEVGPADVILSTRSNAKAAS